jgi:death-on-curing protein
MNSSDNEPVRYLTASDLYNLNDEVTHGHTYVRDVHLLNSAAARPALVVFNEVQFPTLIDKAASLLHSLAYHHLFADGNKRTAQKALVQFLHLNGHRLTWDSATERAFILEVAQGTLDVAQISQRIAPYISPE